MFTFLGIVIARKSELIKREGSMYKMGESQGLASALYNTRRISPRTGLPVRKYTKRK
jgi:hypothetical protein